MRLKWLQVTMNIIIHNSNSILVYNLNHEEKVVFNPVKPLWVDDIFALCYRFRDTWTHGDNWRIDLEEGFYEYPSSPGEYVKDYKLLKALYSFSGITSFLNNENPPDYFQLRWNNVCYMINYVEKTVSFFRNGELVAKKSPDGLKNSKNGANITKITILKYRKGAVTHANLIISQVSPERMKAITSCKTFPEEGLASWTSGAWKLLDNADKELEPDTVEMSPGDLCNQDPYLVMLPLTGFWLGKEKCNILQGKAYLYRNESERLEFTRWVRAWHKKIGVEPKPRPTVDVTDEEEEGVWISSETGEVIAIDETSAPHRIAEHKYENWRPGQPNGGRSENNANYDAYYSTGQGWVDGCSWCPKYYMTCQVRTHYWQQYSWYLLLSFLGHHFCPALT